MLLPDRARPTLSVVMTTWNAAATVERSIESILQERDVALECVVVDDGSTDGTIDVLGSIARRDRRVTVVPLEANEGVSTARNRAMTVVRGEWLAFLDADDRMLPGGIASLMRPTVDPSVRAVVGQRIWSDGERTWISRLYDIPDIRVPGRKSMATHPGLLYYASVTGKAFHRSLTDGLVFEGRALGDQPWAIRALLRAGPDIEVIGDTVFEWSRPPTTGTTTTITSRSRASAAHSTEATRVARRAFREVSDEADRCIDGTDDRAAFKVAYLQRLIRSDLASYLNAAIDRRDLDGGALFDALGEFLESIPGPVLTGAEAVMRLLIRPPWDRWSELAPSARRGYWRMYRAVEAADPEVGSRLLHSRRLVPMLGIAARVSAVSPTVGDLVVRAVRSVAARRRARR